MNKKARPPKRALPRKPKTSITPLIAEVRSLIQSARTAAASAVNTFQVLTNLEIGRRIVEHEQQGQRRAGYGQELLKKLSARLTTEFGRGFSENNLMNMRRFFLTWKERAAEFHNSLLGNCAPRLPTQSRSASRARLDQSKTLKKPVERTAQIEISQQPIVKFRELFPLSWTHYVELLSIQDPAERSFYEIESARATWSIPELKRQKSSCLYERLALSRDKAGVKRLAEKGQLVTRPEELLKEPFILEFLGLDAQSSYNESDLESALITHLEKFLLELGKGFLFQARQKRFTFDGDHFFLDLVFYNRLLRCYVVIDLKLDKLTHQDLGQMQMYVNYFDRHEKLAGENPTIGLLLCKQKKDAIVELTLPPDANIHAREYQLYLPSKKLLKAKLLEWSRAQEARA